MQPSDFLKREAQTPLHELFVAGGAACEIRTNSTSILKAVRESFLPVKDTKQDPEFGMRFWVDSRGGGQPPWPKPYVRGLDQIVFAGFGSGSSILINLRNRQTIGRFSSGLAEDSRYWREVIFPMILSIASGTLGIAELHCACVARNGNGVLLAGSSRSGKSTLSLALSQAGFGLLSDDRTLCSLRESTLSAWGTQVLPKLRPEAAAWFPELRGKEPRHLQNGELIFRCNPDGPLRFKRVRVCEPRSILFLEQRPGSGFDISPMPRAEAAALLAKDLMEEHAQTVEAQAVIIEKLVDLPCWRLQYNAPPHTVAERLAIHFDRLQTGQVLAPAALSLNLTERSDPLRRFTPTPCATMLPVMGRSILLETNEARMLGRAASVFAVYPPSQSGQADFRWRLVSQPGREVHPRWPARSAFSGSGLRFAEFGQTNFVAVDLETREAVGYVARELVEDDLELTSPFLDTLFSMTAGSLGLTSIFAACVGIGGDAVLVVGAPDNGKTSASYVAAKNGLEFHADRAVFLEIKSGQLMAWGDFWPAVFRPDGLKHLPELQSSTRLFRYGDSTSYYLDKREHQTLPICPVTPVCCVFLERRPAETVMPSRISREEFSRRIEKLESFPDDLRFEEQRAAVFKALEALPAYNLTFGNDPTTAAAFFPELLHRHASHRSRV
jgi:hypothetical protein